MRLAAACAAILLTGCAAHAPQPTGPQPSGFTRHYEDQQMERMLLCQDAVERSARRSGVTPDMATRPEIEAVAKHLYQKCLLDMGAAI